MRSHNMEVSLTLFNRFGEKYLDEGICVMPVSKDCTTVKDWTARPDGLSFSRRLPNEEECEFLHSQINLTELALCCGTASDIVAVDLDLHKDSDYYEEFCKIIPETPSKKFGSKGMTSFFKCNDKRIVSKNFKDVLDIIYDGKWTFLPPSIHRITGKEYIWVGDDLLDAYKYLPDLKYEQFIVICDHAKKIKNELIDFEKRSGLKFESHGRNTNLFNQAMKALSKGKSKEEVCKELISYDLSRHSPPWLSDPAENKRSLDPKEFCMILVDRAEKAIDKNKAAVVNQTITSSFSLEDLDLSRTKNKIPINNASNAVGILSSMPEFKDLLWYDEFHDKIYTYCTGGQREWCESDDISLLVKLQIDYKFITLSSGVLREALKLLEKSVVKNEPRDWIKSLKWDGVFRVHSFFTNYMGADDSLYTRAVSKNFWISMPARVCQPGCQVDTMPIFEGKQGTRKSTALSVIGGKWFAEVSEDPKSKDFYQALPGKLILEFGELEAMNRGDIATIKRILTSRFDRYRSSYGRRAEDHPRQCIFTGTTNDDMYLKDTTGNRRFYPIATTRIDVDGIAKYREQFFAEAYHLYNIGENWYETPAEATLEMQSSRKEIDEWEDQIDHYLKGKFETTLIEIAKECLVIDIAKLDQYTQKRMAKILKQIGFNRRVVLEGNKTKRVWNRF